MLLRAGKVPSQQVGLGGVLIYEVRVQYHLTCRECSVSNILAKHHRESGDAFKRMEKGNTMANAGIYISS